MHPRSAVNWDLAEKAKRIQEKLERYSRLLDQIRELEADPDLAQFLSTPLEEGTGHSAEEIASRSKPGDSPRLLAIAEQIEGDFNASDLLEAAQKSDPDLAQRMTLRQVNDHLRRLGTAGRLILITPGKRGKAGTLPRYRVSGATQILPNTIPRAELDQVQRFLDEVSRRKQPLGALLSETNLSWVEGKLRIGIGSDDSLIETRLQQPANRLIVEEAVQEVWGAGATWQCRRLDKILE